MIESPHNPLVKLARSLHRPKGREEAGLFLAEGPAVVAEALAYAPGIEWIAWCRELAGEEGEDLADSARQAGITVHECSRRAFEALSDARAPQGLAAVLQIRPPALSDLSCEGQEAACLILLDVQDPGNVGTMIRTADAFGAQAVILAGQCADAYEPKVVRATAGSLFHLPVVETDWGQVVGWARDQGMVLVAADADGEEALGAAALPARAAYVIGNEAHGLPERVLRDAGRRVRIPMAGRAESLNAAVAAGILLYVACRDVPPERLYPRQNTKRF